MEKSKLLDLLKKLQSRERTRFSEFMHSPYHNKHEALRRLCDYLLKEAPEFNNERKLDKKRIFNYLYPEKEFDNTVFHRLTSQLLELLHQFLMQELWQTRKPEQELLLLEALRQRKIPKNYETIADGWQDAAEFQFQTRSQADIQWLQYRFHHERNAYFIDSGERRYDEHLQSEYDCLVTFFLVEQWRIACDMASRNKVIQGHYTYAVLPHLQAFSETSDYKDYFILNIYKTIFQMLTTAPPNEAPFYHQTKTQIETHKDRLADPDLLEVYGYLLNYAIRQINQGRKEFYAEALSHYRFLVERRLMFVDGYLPAANYKNIVTIALALEEYEWTKGFIEQHRSSLPPDTRENAYSYNLASYYYAVKDYQKALQTLHNVEFTDISYHLGAKIIQIKSYYETDESEALLSLMDTFASYLRRNKEISEAQRLGTTNFLKLTKKLYKIKEGKFYWKKSEVEAKRSELVAELQATSPVTNKLWIENELGLIGL